MDPAGEAGSSFFLPRKHGRHGNFGFASQNSLLFISRSEIIPCLPCFRGELFVGEADNEPYELATATHYFSIG
jgi:hypothetical protein